MSAVISNADIRRVDCIRNFGINCYIQLQGSYLWTCDQGHLRQDRERREAGTKATEETRICRGEAQENGCSQDTGYTVQTQRGSQEGDSEKEGTE